MISFKNRLSVLASLLICCVAFGQTAIMSFNIRYDNPQDGENWWNNRKDEVVDLLKYYTPDILGLQEALPNQTKFVQENLKQYSHIGHGRDGRDTDSEATPIFYKKDKYKLLDEQIFWLSETPEEVSRGWDADLNRIAVYGVFLNKSTKDTLFIFNTHFDHRGKLARLKSAELLLKIIEVKQLSNKKLIVMGDLNALPNEDPIKLLMGQLEDSHKKGDYPVYGPPGTFNAFDINKILSDRIDYIFTKNLVISSYRCIDDRRTNNLYPSDHLPVFIKTLDSARD